jgi:uncharacterized caspase-like protein
MHCPAGLCRFVGRLALALTVGCLFAATAVHAEAGRRMALVIGNGRYLNVTPLANPSNDATELAKVLGSLGFEVDLQIDVDKARMQSLVGELSRRTSGVELALLFYAGHGFQIDGKNFIVPVDARIRTEQDVATEAVDVDRIVAEMNPGVEVKVVLLDACRNNPFEAELSRSLGPTRAEAMLGRGLTPIQPAGGVLIGFATDPGAVAFDGTGDNSPFTEALLVHLPTPHVEINSLMTRVRADVFASTGHLQRPWTTTSLLQEVYLDDRQPDQPDPEVAAWQAAEAAGTNQALADFAALHPDGSFHDQAEAQLVVATVERAEGPEDGTSAPAQGAAGWSDSFRHCLDCPQMQPLPTGTFTMGAEFGPDSEKPQSERTVAPRFAMGRTEVTRREWRVCAEAGACRPLPGPVDEGPAAGLSWDDVQSYLAWLGRVTGHPYRLPSEAEWEYAAQGGEGLRYPTGPILFAKAAHFDRADGAPVRVASYQPNPFGLHDLAGNVWEWVADCGAQYDARMTGTAAVKARPCIHVLRGGSFRSSADQLRSSNRFFPKDGSSRDDYGFRVALDMP